jgi:Zn-dependent M28 family amino/carboxypeptidase
MDAVNQWGRTTDLTVIGLGASDLDDFAKAAAAEQGRVLKPDAEPEKGFYYRSDHFEFAKQGAWRARRAAPAISASRRGMRSRSATTTPPTTIKVTDEVRPDWDPAGAAEDAQLLFQVGYGDAAAGLPEWNPRGVKARRDQMLAALPCRDRQQ